MSKRRLVELDVARAVAILLAVGWHFYTPTGIWIVDAVQAPGMLFGWAGVDLFFVLSGFLVGGLIFDEVHRTGGMDARRFLIRRVFKIWPVLYIYIALVVITGRYQPMEVVPQTILHVQNYWTTPINHLWSLAVEEHFYLIFAFLATAFHLSTGNASKVPLILITIMVGGLLLRVVAAGLDVSTQSLQYQTQFRADALACGVLLAYLKQFRPNTFAWLVRQKAIAAAIVVVGVAFLVVSRGNAYLIATVGYTITWLTAAAFLVLLFEAFPKPGIAVRAAAWIGTYSYAMYVFQFVMFRALERGWQMLLETAAPPLALLAMKYGGAVLIAVIITKTIERPLLSLRNRLFPN